jgi:hypothetical protein
MMWTRPLYTLFITLFLPLSVMATALYEGSWELQEAFDTEMAHIHIPDGSFRLQLYADSGDDNIYDFDLKVGNQLGGRLAIIGETETETGHTVKIGPIRSTMMMPPEPLFKLETALSALLPSMNTIKLQGDTLTLEGTKGKLVCQRS